MAASTGTASWWGRTLRLSLFLCGCGLSAARALFNADDGAHHRQERRLRSSDSRRAIGGRHLQADDGTTPRKALVRNIELRVGNAPAMISATDKEQFETVMEDWFLAFYAERPDTATMISTTVTFTSQKIEEGDSVILYHQAFTYIPRSKDVENPNIAATLPFSVLKNNAQLSNDLTSSITAWANRPPGLFLVAPKVLGQIPTEAPTDAPTKAPTTRAPITESPTAATTDAPAAEPTDAPVAAPTSPAPVLLSTTDAPSASEPTGAPSLAVSVSSAPVVPTAAPTWSPVNVTLEELELIFSNVDTIDPEQLTLLENVTEMWFNEYFYSDNATSSSSSSSEPDEGDEDAAPNGNVTAMFSFVSQEYNNTTRTLTVLFAVQLTYRGDPDEAVALAILQTPWQEATSVGAYRQLLVAELLTPFAAVEATAPPKSRNIGEPTPPPKPKVDDDDGGLSLGVIIGIAIIVVAVIVLICVAVKVQCNVIARRKERNSNGGDKISPSATTPYRPHVNEDDDSVLFPQTSNPYMGNSTNKERPVAVPVADASTAGGVSMPSSKSDDQSYDGKSVDTTEFDYSKVGADSVRRLGAGVSSSGLSSATPSVASGQSSNMYNENSSDMLTPIDNEEQFVIYAPAGKLGLVVDNRDNGPPVIHSIKEDSVLIDQIQVGDRLIGVDEVDVRTLSPVRVSKLISKRSTNPLRKLTLTRRGVQERDILADDKTSGDQSSFVGGMSRMSGTGFDTDSNDDESALGQGFSDDDTSFVGSMSRVSGDGQSMDGSTVAR